MARLVGLVAILSSMLKPVGPDVVAACAEEGVNRPSAPAAATVPAIAASA